MRGIKEPVSDFLRTQKKDKNTPFTFHSMHSLNESEVDDISGAMEQSADLEDILNVIVGVFTAATFLSFVVYKLIGTSSFVLTGISMGIILLSSHFLKTAQTRFLSKELQNISAGKWKIESIIKL